MTNLEKLRNSMAEQNCNAYYISDLKNVRWLTGFTGSMGVVLVTPQYSLFITDSRYTIQAEAQVQGVEVKSFASPQNLYGFVAEQASALSIKELKFEPSVTVGNSQHLKSSVPDVKWECGKDLIAELRKIKSNDEIEKIKEACKLADQCMAHVSRVLQIGVSEYDVNLEVEFFYRRHGAGLAFEPIVVSGPNSAKPHGKAGERKLTPGDFVTIDCGGELNGYNSDITRTFVVGEPTPKHREVYEQVLKAEIECCKALIKGKTGKEIDSLAREILDEKDLSKYFGHGLGHGLGLDVHDPGGLSQRSTDVMTPGMVFTVEPGVYIDGFGGVRIEDDVLVTEGEPEILTHYPKELTVIG